jgi:ATP-dependent helicase/nuclease subunit B
LRTVIAALVDGRLIDGFARPARAPPSWRATLICRPGAPDAWRAKFLDELKTDAVVLPRIVALGDIDEDELAFAEQAEPYGGVAPLDIPPKLGELDRRLTLARLVAAWAKRSGIAPLVVGGPASTLALASDLAP